MIRGEISCGEQRSSRSDRVRRRAPVVVLGAAVVLLLAAGVGRQRCGRPGAVAVVAAPHPARPGRRCHRRGPAGTDQRGGDRWHAHRRRPHRRGRHLDPGNPVTGRPDVDRVDGPRVRHHLPLRRQRHRRGRLRSGHRRFLRGRPEPGCSVRRRASATTRWSVSPPRSTSASAAVSPRPTAPPSNGSSRCARPCPSWAPGRGCPTPPATRGSTGDPPSTRPPGTKVHVEARLYGLDLGDAEFGAADLTS